MEIEIIDQPDSQDVKELDDGGGVFECSYKPKTGAPKQTVLINYGGVAVPGSPLAGFELWGGGVDDLCGVP